MIFQHTVKRINDDDDKGDVGVKTTTTMFLVKTTNVFSERDNGISVEPLLVGDQLTEFIASSSSSVAATSHLLTTIQEKMSTTMPPMMVKRQCLFGCFLYLCFVAYALMPQGTPCKLQLASLPWLDLSFLYFCIHLYLYL